MTQLNLICQYFVFALFTLVSSQNTNNNRNSSCLTNPSNLECADYTLEDKDISTRLESLCKQMPNMPGCTIKAQCEKDVSFPKSSKDLICSPFSLLADVCLKDMPKMADCGEYTKMCTPNTAIKQCINNKPLNSLPTTSEATKLVQGICSDMQMPGCEKCKDNSGECDLLGVYTDLCKSMPDMKQCDKFKLLCDEVGKDSQICQSKNSYGDLTPLMRMYFHTGLADYILFKSWVPQSGSGYFGSFVAIVLMGVLYEFLIVVRNRAERKWADRSSPVLCNYSFLQFRIDTMRGALRFVEVLLSYSLMLIAMTFNVGLFIAVILGMAIGTFMFSRFSQHTSDLKPGCGC